LNQKRDYYEVLGVKRDASLRQIKQAYRDLVRQYHPDAAGDSAQARRRFDLLQEAYEVLSDAGKRAQHDASLPPRKYPLAELDAEGLWREATDVLFERSDSFSKMLEVMRVAAPIALEGNLIVVGVAGKDQYLAGHLETPANRHRIVEALREFGGPPFQNVQLAAAGAQVGVRETRRLKGVYILTEDDAKSGKRFQDAVAWRSGMLDIGFVRWEEMRTHDVPYRALLPEKVDGMLVAGRCISATHVAASAGKSMGNCMATGHAAGLAAAMSAASGCVPRALDVRSLQRALVDDGVDLSRLGD